MSWAADGQDGNGLHLKKNEATFFKFIAYVKKKKKKLAKILIMVYFLLEIHLISSFWCSISILCTAKVRSSNLRPF